VQNGLLYGVGNGGGVFVIDTNTVVATFVSELTVAAPGVTGAAYTNNDFNQSSTGTTLFDLDTTLDQIAIQSPPGNGILVATGKLGVDAGAVSGFDIYSQLRAGITISNHALALLEVGGNWGLYSIELTTGKATRVGALDEPVVDIAIPLSQKPEVGPIGAPPRRRAVLGADR
jgi:hypothetical protein